VHRPVEMLVSQTTSVEGAHLFYHGVGFFDADTINIAVVKNTTLQHVLRLLRFHEARMSELAKRINGNVEIITSKNKINWS